MARDPDQLLTSEISQFEASNFGIGVDFGRILGLSGAGCSPNFQISVQIRGTSTIISQRCVSAVHYALIKPMFNEYSLKSLKIRSRSQNIQGSISTPKANKSNGKRVIRVPFPPKKRGIGLSRPEIKECRYQYRITPTRKKLNRILQQRLPSLTNKHLQLEFRIPCPVSSEEDHKLRHNEKIILSHKLLSVDEDLTM